VDRSSRAGLLSRLFHSFSLKLLFLALILLTVPIILYWQFQREQTEQLNLAQNAANKRGRVIAAMLTPHFAAFKNEAPDVLRDALAGAAIDNTNVKILVRMAGAGPSDFVYIASAPVLPADYLRQERLDLIRSGVFARLAPACDRPTTNLALPFVNPAGKEEILTSMTPAHVGGSCWVVVTSQNAASFAPALFDPPFWTEPALRAAATLYFLSAFLVLLLFFHLWRNVSRFRKAARRIRMRGAGEVSFHQLNTIPELTRVAEDFDSLVSALTASQAFIVQAAEENAHALKAPLAVIAQSLEPLKRSTAASDPAAQRSIQLIERSIAKLDSLVSAARDTGRAAAEVVYPVRRRIDLTSFAAQMSGDYSALLAAQGKRLSAAVAEGVTAYANEDLLEVIIENLLENAASFTPRGGTVDFRLERSDDVARIRVADRGPGVDSDMLPRIFDRYVSHRAEPMEMNGVALAADSHQGLGLWIVKRNVEGLGGSVMGRNREGGGFEIIVDLNAKT
jgi:two-component system sensor histidine kinase ChvG